MDSIKAELIGPPNSDVEDDIDDLDELLRGAQSIIEEYQAVSQRNLSLDISAITPENLYREVQEILSYNNHSTVEQDFTSNPNNIAAEVAQTNNSQTEEDDDVVFISSEPSRIPDVHVIDLCTPVQMTNNRRSRRRSAHSFMVTLGDSISSEDTSPKRVYNPPPPSLNNSTEELASTASSNGLKLTCAVCMDNPTKYSPMATVCGHIFCKKCILKAIKCTKKCPLCNKKLTKAMAHRIYI